MCQLLGMNCNTPTDIVFSFQGFRQRGGLTDVHTDGFGIAFFEGKGVRLFHDNHACSTSPIAELIKDYPIRSLNVISHIRKATQGKNSLVNTHPFTREIWGEYWVFAHNGQIKNFEYQHGDYFNPVGDSDSEQIFCYFLETLKQRFGSQEPSKEEIFNVIHELTENIREKGLLNYLISNGDWMIAYCDSLLFYKIRQSPFGEAQLLDEDVKVDFSKVTTPNDKVAVIATLPLTANEEWKQLAKNELVMFQNGEIILRKTPTSPYYYTIEEGRRLAQSYSVA
ncbi:class II glutamine amidotransferase [Neisseriaceae bacterium PsAf]|nr:class II glutamine amidotransferase [Neisseriaceae bacterium PsAf]